MDNWQLQQLNMSNSSKESSMSRYVESEGLQKSYEMPLQNIAIKLEPEIKMAIGDRPPWNDNGNVKIEFELENDTSSGDANHVNVPLYRNHEVNRQETDGTQNTYKMTDGNLMTKNVNQRLLYRNSSSSCLEERMDRITDKAEEAREQSGDKRRGLNFTQRELDLLRELVMSNIHILENKKSHAIMWKKKKECWQKISREWNSKTSNSRSTDTLRKKWDNYKRHVKDKVTKQRERALKTGAPFTPNLEPGEEEILNLISVKEKGTESVCDNDVVDLSQFEDQNSSTAMDKMDEEEVPEQADNSKSDWSDYTPVCSKPLTVLPVDDEIEISRRERKRTSTGQSANKAWAELAVKKKEVASLKAGYLKNKIALTEALIAESEERKHQLKLQNELLELELKAKKECNQALN